LGDLSVDWSIILSRDRVTIDGVWIGNIGFIGLLNTQLVTTLYRSLPHKDKCSQSQSSRLCLVTSSNSGRSSTPGHLIPTSYSGLCRNGSWSSLYSFGMDRTENTATIIASSFVAGETCPQNCSLATAVVLSPVYTAVTWQWVCMQQY
jgi:hypothetical protein